MSRAEVLLVFGMFVVTFGVRYLLFGLAGRLHFPAWLHHALNFVPPVVLTSIVLPAVLMPQGDLWLSVQNPWLLSAFVAFVVALIRKDLLTTIVIGLLTFVTLRFALGL